MSRVSFMRLVRTLQKLESLDIDEMMELMELTQDFLDSLWRVCRHSDDEKGLVAAYSKQGMTYLLHVVGKALFDALCKMISKVDLWMDPFLKVPFHLSSRFISLSSRLLTFISASLGTSANDESEVYYRSFWAKTKY